MTEAYRLSEFVISNLIAWLAVYIMLAYQIKKNDKILLMIMSGTDM